MRLIVTEPSFAIFLTNPIMLANEKNKKQAPYKMQQKQQDNDSALLAQQSRYLCMILEPTTQNPQVQLNKHRLTNGFPQSSLFMQRFIRAIKQENQGKVTTFRDVIAILGNANSHWHEIDQDILYELSEGTALPTKEMMELIAETATSFYGKARYGQSYSRHALEDYSRLDLIDTTLKAKYGRLEALYEQLSEEHSQLLADFSSISENHSEWLKEYAELEGDYTALLAEHRHLIAKDESACLKEDVSFSNTTNPAPIEDNDPQYAPENHEIQPWEDTHLFSDYLLLQKEYTALRTDHSQLCADYLKLQADNEQLCQNGDRLGWAYKALQRAVDQESLLCQEALIPLQDAETIGDALRLYREHLGLSPKEMGQRVGLPKSHASLTLKREAQDWNRTDRIQNILEQYTDILGDEHPYSKALTITFKRVLQERSVSEFHEHVSDAMNLMEQGDAAGGLRMVFRACLPISDPGANKQGRAETLGAILAQMEGLGHKPYSFKPVQTWAGYTVPQVKGATGLPEQEAIIEAAGRIAHRNGQELMERLQLDNNPFDVIRFKEAAAKAGYRVFVTDQDFVKEINAAHSFQDYVHAAITGFMANGYDEAESAMRQAGPSEIVAAEEVAMQIAAHESANEDMPAERVMQWMEEWQTADKKHHGNRTLLRSVDTESLRVDPPEKFGDKTLAAIKVRKWAGLLKGELRIPRPPTMHALGAILTSHCREIRQDYRKVPEMHIEFHPFKLRESINDGKEGAEIYASFIDLLANADSTELVIRAGIEYYMARGMNQREAGAAMGYALAMEIPEQETSFDRLTVLRWAGLTENKFPISDAVCNAAEVVTCYMRAHAASQASVTTLPEAMLCGASNVEDSHSGANYLLLN